MDQDTAVPTDTYDVAIVGLGPVGLFSAILLGRQGYRVAGFDRWPTPYALPRAVTFDHEIARLLNVIGIDADADPAINHYDGIYRWVNAEGQPLMEIDWMSTAPDGWRNRYWFSQPALEQRLREIAASLPGVELFQGFEVDSLDQDDSGVSAHFRQTHVLDGKAMVKPDGLSGTTTARFLIGSDGANSGVRRSLGLEMTDLQFYYDWLVVDVLPHERMTFDPPHYQMCDPARPTTVVPGGPGPVVGGPDRRRWEFMALPDESLTELGTPEKTWELLAPFGVHPGNAELERSVVWRFQAKHLERWHTERVALAGDAAHLMPPFAGEGMCAGLRDAINLCWRLDLALRGDASFGILDGYTSERKPHIQWYIQFSVDIGRVICVTDEAAAAERDRALLAEHQARHGQPIHPHDAVLGPGAWIEDDPVAGRPAIQGRVAYRGRAGRFEDTVARGWTLISRVGADAGLHPADAEAFRSIGGVVVSVGPAGSGADVVDLDATYLSWFDEHELDHLLVRPDFYVAATAGRGASMQEPLATILQTLSVGRTREMREAIR